MLTRRQLLGSTVLAGLGSQLARRAAAADPAAADSKAASAKAAASSPKAAADFCSYVDPFIGTGGHGHTFPGATVPFGMVQLSPDTDVARWDACSGYHHDDASILGFSHTHLSGTGVGDMMDVLVVPATGPVRLRPGSLEHPEEGYRSRFDHADERISRILPGVAQGARHRGGADRYRTGRVASLSVRTA